MRLLDIHDDFVLGDFLPLPRDSGYQEGRRVHDQESGQTSFRPSPLRPRSAGPDLGVG